MWRRRLLYNCPESKIKNIEDATYGDICFYDKKNDEKIIVDKNEFYPCSLPLSDYAPIGIVAIPSSHTDENRPRIVSLANLSHERPDSGILTSNPYMFWGGYRYGVTDLPTKSQFPYLPILSEDGIVNYTTNNFYLPSDDFSALTDNPLNSLEGFNSTSLYRMCSPYKEDGSKEERYFDSSNTGNVLADFDGKSNTEKILALDNRNSTDWQTATTISNEGDNPFIHPAAQCCWRFHTDGTKQGDWYLPSAGELGYALARKGSIDLAINTLNTQYNQTLGILFRTSYYWSSTQYSNRDAVCMRFENGYVYSDYKNFSDSVRAFLAI